MAVRERWVAGVCREVDPGHPHVFEGVLSRPWHPGLSACSKGPRRERAKGHRLSRWPLGTLRLVTVRPGAFYGAIRQNPVEAVDPGYDGELFWMARPAAVTLSV